MNRLESEWRLLSLFTHPEPARCLVTGAGHKHKASADNRQAMHHKSEELSDSMAMYLSELEGGRSEPGKNRCVTENVLQGLPYHFVRPWRTHQAHPFAGDGDEEQEIAGLYVIDSAGAYAPESGHSTTT